MNPILTIKAILMYRHSYTWRGMPKVLRVRWCQLVFQPEREYQNACGLADGVFS